MKPPWLLPNRPAVLSMLLRIALLAAKFIFLMSLARDTNAATVGVYALLVAVTTIAIYFIGGELHTHAVREIVVADERAGRSHHFQNHLIYVSLFFLIGLPVSWGAICWLHIDQEVPFILFSLVLLGEVLSQELGRYLIAMSLPVASNVLQLLRGAVWMPVAIMLFGVGRPIDVTLSCWAAGCACAIGFGAWRLRALLGSYAGLSRQWLRLALQGARYYFVVALLTQIQAFADRLIVQLNLGAEFVGQLTFFQSFANTIQGFVLTGVVSIALPELLVLARNGRFTEAAKVSRKILLGGSVVAASISVCVILGIGWVLALVGKVEYTASLHLLPWMLLGNYFVIVGQVQHYRLYSLRQDKTLMVFALVTTPVALALNWGATRLFGLNGTVGCFAAVSFAQAVIKWWVADRAWPRQRLSSLTGSAS